MYQPDFKELERLLKHKHVLFDRVGIFPISLVSLERDVLALGIYQFKSVDK